MNTELYSLAGPGFLSGGLVSGATSITVRSGTLWPVNLSGTFRVAIDREIKRLQGAASGSLTYNIIEAGAEGTLEAAHNDLAAVNHLITPQAIKNIVGSVNPQTGTSYTVGAADARSLVTHSNGSAIAVTLPQATTGDNSDFGPHFLYATGNLGAGLVTITPTTSTINGAATLTLRKNQWAIVYSDGTNYSALVIGETAFVTSGSIASGQVGWPLIANAGVLSGNIGSGQLAAVHTQSGILLAGAGIGVTHGLSGITLTNLSGAAAGLASGSVQSGHVASGAVQGFFGSTRHIASGTVGVYDFGSGAVIAGTVGSGAIVSGNIASGQLGNGHLADSSIRSGAIGSGQVAAAHTVSGILIAGGGIGVAHGLSGITLTNLSGAASTIGSGSISSGLIASGTVQGFFGSTRHIASGTVGVYDLGSGAVIAGTVGSGAVQSGNLHSGLVQFTHMASGAPCTIVSGTAPSNPTIGQIWLDSSSSGVFGLSSGSVTSGYIGNAAVNWNNLASGVIISGGQLYFQNYIANGGFWFPILTSGLRVTSGMSGGDGVGPTSWTCAVSSGSHLLYLQWDRLTSGYASGVDARYYGAFQFGASGHKAVIYQPLASDDSQNLANKNVIFQARAKSTISGMFLRMGVLQTNSGVTADVVPNSLVSGFSVGTSGTDPTWGSGVSLAAPAVTFLLSSGVWSDMDVSVALSSGGVTIIPAVWANGPQPSGSIIHITEAGLYQN